MKARILFLAAVGFLAGCASSNVYWGPALITYGSGSADTFASGGSRSGAEYDTARKKHKRSHDQVSADKDNEVDEIEEVQVGASSKIESP